MPGTSGTYNFQSIQVEILIREAFERIGISGEFIEPLKLDSAKRSINFLLLSWMDKTINLWTLQGAYLPLVTGQRQYTLPNTVSNIIQANLRNSTRQLNGVASSTIRQLNGTPQASAPGVAANAFDGNLLTSCDEDPTVGGFISYDYGVGNTQTITMVGITSFVTRQYSITVQTSVDNINWVQLFLILPQSYVAGQTVVFNVLAPIATRAYRILENGNAGNRVLNIAELYFENNVPNVNAENAFDGNPSTACIQDIANGNISYDYGFNVTQYITFIGIQSNATTLYSLIVEYSQDTITWATLITIPPQTFPAGVNTWFDVPTPTNARAYRVRETGGAILDIQEIYFSNNTFDFVISDVSKYEYNTYPNKYLQSRPSVYYLDRQPFAPILNLWPTPSRRYNCLFYSYKKMMQDVGLYTEAIEIPSRFYPSLVWGLSWHLALKFKPDIAQMMQVEYEQSFNTATSEDSEGTNISIQGEN
jgi:hypothetical protein